MRNDGLPGKVRYGFSAVSDGNMALHCGEPLGTAGNRARFLETLGIDYRSLVLPVQVHGAAVVNVTLRDAGRGALNHAAGVADTDALVTCAQGIPVGVLTADCLPVLMVDPARRAVAAVHGGWKSTRQRIAGLTVGRMGELFGSVPADIHCLFGPAIRPCCYEVGPEFREIFPRSVKNNGNGLRLDLALENKLQLIDAGIDPNNIIDKRLCTCCDDKFFSFRRQGAAGGRLLSVIMLS